MECHRQLGCSAAEVSVLLSRYLDGELEELAALEIEEHLKECAKCRDELSGLRGVDRNVAHSVGGVKASDGFVARVMAAIMGRGRGGRAGGRVVPRSVVWAIIIVAGLGVCAAAVIGALAILRPPKALREIALKIAAGTPGSWSERRTRRRKPLIEKAPGEALRAGTVLELGPAGGGAIERADGLRLFAPAGTRLSVSESASDRRGVSLDFGASLVARPAGSGPFELGLPDGAALSTDGPATRVHVEVDGGVARVTALKGTSLLTGPWGEGRELAAGRSVDLEGGRIVAGPGRTDLRALDLDFAPPELRISAWPQVGGSAAREGSAPFAFKLPPRNIRRLKGGSGASAPVLGLDGTVYFLADPASRKLVGVRGSEVVLSVRLLGPRVGDPAIEPDGAILVAMRSGSVVRHRPGQMSYEVVTLPPGEIPCVGPTVAPRGDIYVVTRRSLSAYDSQGRRLWRRDVRASSTPSIGPDGTVYIATIGGKLRALDPEDGSNLPSSAAPVNEPFAAHVAVAPDGTAYAVSSSRYLLWRAPDGKTGRAELPVSEYLLAPAIAPDGAVIVASNEGLVWRLPPRPTDAPRRPFFDAGERITQGPIVDLYGKLVVWTMSGKLVAVETSGRSRDWELGVSESSPAAVSRDGTLHFITRDGRVFGR